MAIKMLRLRTGEDGNRLSLVVSSGAGWEFLDQQVRVSLEFRAPSNLIVVDNDIEISFTLDVGGVLRVRPILHPNCGRIEIPFPSIDVRSLVLHCEEMKEQLRVALQTPNDLTFTRDEILNHSDMLEDFFEENEE